MLTKVYQRDDDYRFTDQLHQAAIYSPDRAVLFDIVHSAKLQKVTVDNSKDEIVVAPNKIGEVAIPEPIATIEEIVHVALKTPELEKIEEEDEIASILAEKSQELISDRIEKNNSSEEVSVVEVQEKAAEKPVAIEISDPIVEEVEVPSRKISVADMEPMEREILLEAISSSIELEVGESEEDFDEEIISSSDQLSSLVTSSSDEIQKEEDTGEPLSMAAYLARRAKEIHFGEALTREFDKNSPTNEQKMEFESHNESSETIISEKEELPWEDSGTNISHGHKKINVSGEREHQQSLIDKFIKAEPRITPGKAAEYNLQTAAKESLEEDFEFVTETMARLFAQQGKPDKARKAFKKLMEQHPEKSVYFAAQLKNLDRIKKP